MRKLFSVTLLIYAVAFASAQTCPTVNTTATRHYHTSANGQMMIDTDPMPTEIATFLASSTKGMAKNWTNYFYKSMVPPKTFSTTTSGASTFDGTGPIPVYCFGSGCYQTCCFGGDCWVRCVCCGDNWNGN